MSARSGTPSAALAALMSRKTFHFCAGVPAAHARTMELIFSTPGESARLPNGLNGIWPSSCIRILSFRRARAKKIRGAKAHVS
jgi:hypothetical protein